MRVIELWRHPVKSLVGERLAEAAFVSDGLVGDRSWGILDVATERILTGRREPRLLYASSRLDARGALEITLPSGERLSGCGPATDEALSSWLGNPVRLVAAAESAAARAEYFADATDDTSKALEWTMPQGRFVDAMPVLVITTAGLRACRNAYPAGEWDMRRFRPNVVIDVEGDGWLEDAWCGRTLRIGPVELAPRQPCKRCTMVTRAQPGLVKDVEIFRTLWRTHQGTAGVWSSVIQGGLVVEGASATVE
jgi:uncharacterized protein YcbX